MIKFPQFTHLTGFPRCYQKATFEIALDAIFPDALVDDVIAAPTEIPDHVGNSFAVPCLNLAQAADAIDQLSAVSAGRTPADAVGFNQCYRVATFGQGQSGCNPGKAGTNHADVR